MTRLRIASRCVALALVSCVTGLTACGSGGGNAVVVKVGSRAITEAMVDHWAHAASHGGTFGGVREPPTGGTARQRAIALLISSAWLTGEAERQGILLSGELVDETLAERERENGRFNATLRASGLSRADAELEMKAELAAEALRGGLASRAAQTTPREVAETYRSNLARFRTPEERVVEIITHLPSQATAEALVRRIGTGPRFAHIAYSKVISRSPDAERTPEEAQVANAMLTATPGAVSSPMRYEDSWAVFIVRRKLPQRVEPLSSVHAQVVEEVNLRHQRQSIASFDRAYRARWGAQTTCSTGFIGAGCPQFKGQLGAYEDPFSTGARLFLAKRHW
jgi:PPIC-type PPIASE domain/SurA N-terminal domain